MSTKFESVLSTEYVNNFSEGQIEGFKEKEASVKALIKDTDIRLTKKMMLYVMFYLADKDDDILQKNYWLERIINETSSITNSANYYTKQYWNNYGMEKMEVVYKNLTYEEFFDMLFSYIKRRLLTFNFSERCNFADVSAVCREVKYLEKSVTVTMRFSFLDAVKGTLLHLLQKHYPLVTRYYLDAYIAMRKRGFDFSTHSIDEAVEFASKVKISGKIGPLTVRRLYYVFEYDKNEANGGVMPGPDEDKFLREKERKERIKALNICDTDANYYESVAAFARAHGVSVNVVQHYRQKNHYTYLEISKLLKGGKRLGLLACQDHRGVWYKSFRAMCESYGFSRATVQYRLNQHMSLEEALTTKRIIRKEKREAAKVA